MNPEVFPLPPSDISRRKVSLIEFDGPLFRTHSIRHGPIFFGNSRQNRFDSPDDAHRVLYAGRGAYCSFIQTFARAAGTRVLTTTELKSKALSEIRATRKLRLVDLTQSGTLIRLGVDAHLFSGKYSTSQLWSKALHDHPSKPDGLLYPSRLDPTRHGIVLFEDRAPKLGELTRQSWYAPGPQRLLLAEIIEHYDLELTRISHEALGKRPSFMA